jgi:hypothetical protein
MTVNEMSVDEIFMDKKRNYKTFVDKMSETEMTVDKVYLDKMCMDKCL